MKIQNLIPIICLSFLIQSITTAFGYEHSDFWEKRIKVDANGSGLPAAMTSLDLNAIGRIYQEGSNGPRGFGTVSHIGDGLVVTAGHVIRKESCPRSVIQWGARDGRIAQVSRCIEVIHREVGRYYDVAIFRVDIVPDAAIELALDDNPPDPGTRLLLLGHLAGSDLLEGRGQMKLMRKRSSMVAALPSGSGDSGAPIFSEATGSLVGIYSGREGLEAIGTWIGRVMGHL